MTTSRKWCAALLLALGFCLAGQPSAAQPPAPSLDALRTSGDFKASMVIETTGDSAAPLYERIPFILAIDVATTGWFSRGSRVRDFRIPGAIVRPMSSFADNRVQRENGQSWTIQRWRFRVYAQQPGALALPDVRVFASVADAENAPVEGEVGLSHAPLHIEALPGASSPGDWIAASELTLTQSWSAQRETLLPGDAMTRTRRFEALDAPGMLLPEPETEELPGLSLYRKPGMVRDASNRGVLRGIREDELVITAELPGDYTLPGLDYRWFNTRSKQFETITVPAYHFRVLAVDAGTATTENADKNQLRTLKSWLRTPGLGVAIAMLMVIGFGWRCRHSTALAGPVHTLQQQLTHAARRRAFSKAVRRGDSKEALRLLLMHRVSHGGDARLTAALGGAPTMQQTLRQLLEHAYGSGSTLPAPAEAAALFRRVATTDTPRAPHPPGILDTLMLNPTTRAKSRA